MNSNLGKQEIVIEIKELIEGIEAAKDQMNIYCDLVKQIFLSGSKVN